MSGLSDSSSLIAFGVDIAQGWAQGITVPAPAAAVATIGRIAPGETWERVQFGRATLTADATVGNRTILIQIVDVTGNVWWEAPASLAVVASTSVEVSFSTGIYPALAASGVSVVPIPDTVLQAGFGFQLTATLVGAADAWGPLRLYTQRFPSEAVHVGPAG